MNDPVTMAKAAAEGFIQQAGLELDAPGSGDSPQVRALARLWGNLDGVIDELALRLRDERPPAFAPERAGEVADELARRIDALQADGNIDSHAAECLGGILEWLGAFHRNGFDIRPLSPADLARMGRTLYPAGCQS